MWHGETIIKGGSSFGFIRGLILCSFPLGFFSYYNFALQELTWMVNQFLYSIISMNQIPFYMAHIIENNIEIYIYNNDDETRYFFKSLEELS